ncbi:MAG: HD domain-containing phosphohydrolase [Motiliproteus sp.]
MTHVQYIGPNTLPLEGLEQSLPSNCQLSAVDSLPTDILSADLILLNYSNFQHYGKDHCERYIQQSIAAGVPVLMVWPEGQDYAQFALASGCADYLRPPFHPAVVRSKIRTHLMLAYTLRDHSFDSELGGDQQQELSVAQDAAILCLAAMARVKDHSTGNHILRTQNYVKALAEHLRHHPRFKAELDSDEGIDLLYKTAALHDIGKVVIPDAILQKEGKLTAEEYEIMQQHPRFGYEAVRTAEELLHNRLGPGAERFLKIAQQLTLSHHEHWDGSGYPQGLQQEQIPVVARLMAVADVYDAVVSRRPYKDACPHSKAAALLIEGRGSHFDPAVIDAFIELEDTFKSISTLLESHYPSLSALNFGDISKT